MIIRTKCIDRAALQSLTPTERVKLLGKLRDIVGLRMPLNKVKSPIMSDFDIFSCHDTELQLALDALTPKAPTTSPQNPPSEPPGPSGCA